MGIYWQGLTLSTSTLLNLCNPGLVPGATVFAKTNGRPGTPFTMRCRGSGIQQQMNQGNPDSRGADVPENTVQWGDDC